MRRNSALFPHRIHNHPALPGRRDEAGAWFERCDAQAPGDEAARQLPASTPDLKHMITAPDPRDLTSLVDEFVGISRTPAVVLGRDLIKDRAVPTGSRFWPRGHSALHSRSLPCSPRPGGAVQATRRRLGVAEVHHRGVAEGAEPEAEVQRGAGHDDQVGLGEGPAPSA